MNGDKLTFQNERGNVFGIHIKVNTLKELEDLTKALKFNPYNATEAELIHNSNQAVYLVNIMKNRLDPNAKRGAIVKALAFGSKRPHIPECFKPVANALLESIFKAAEESKSS